MAIKNGEVADADEVLNNCVGTQFKNYAQLLYNSAYIGFNSKLNNATGSPNLKNIKYDVFNSDTAYNYHKISYSSINKCYQTNNSVDVSNILYYVIITASSYSGSLGITNGILQISSNKWILIDPTYYSDSKEVQKAKIFKKLFYDNDILNFTSITSFKVSDSNDVDLRFYRINYSVSCSNNQTKSGTGTFTSAGRVFSWARAYVTAYAPSSYIRWECPTGTVLISSASGFDQFGTDTSSQTKINPADCRIQAYAPTSGDIVVDNGQVVLSCSKNGSFSFNQGTLDGASLVDYRTTYSIPDTTQAGSLSSEGFTLSGTFVEFRTTGLSTIKDCIATWNANINSQNTLTVSISADGTNYEQVTDSTIKRFTNTGTNLYVKFEINRVNTSVTDTISEYAVLYNITGA